MPSVKGGGGSGTKQGKIIGNSFVALKDIIVNGNEILLDDLKGIITSRKEGAYKRVVAILYDPGTGGLIIEYEDT